MTTGKEPTLTTDRILDRRITVCDKCLMACCWQGILMCEESRGASTTDMPVHKLRMLQYENPEYWLKDPTTGAIDQHAMAEYKALS